MGEPSEMSPPDRGNGEQEASARSPGMGAAVSRRLIVTGSLREALADARIGFETAWALRKAEPEFAMYWDRAMQAHRRIVAGVAFAEAVADEAASIH